MSVGDLMGETQGVGSRRWHGCLPCVYSIKIYVAGVRSGSNGREDKCSFPSSYSSDGTKFRS